jgi:microcompartment protein CcmK/EutM
MITARVCGTVVSSQRSDEISGAKFLLIQKCDASGKKEPEYMVALDSVGAGYGEMVLVSQGSACRQTVLTDEKPIDALIIGIVDLIDQENKVVYQK